LARNKSTNWCPSGGLVKLLNPGPEKNRGWAINQKIGWVRKTGRVDLEKNEIRARKKALTARVQIFKSGPRMGEKKKI